MIFNDMNFDFIEFLNFKTKPFKAKFIPSKVYNSLDRCKNNEDALENFCKRWRTSVEFVEALPESAESVCVGGEYDPELNKITMFIHSRGFAEHSFTDETWEGFKFVFVQILMHELIHLFQFNRRGGRWYDRFSLYKKHKKEQVNEIRDYLSNHDEIGAYAHCIWLEYRSYYDMTVDISDIMENKSKRRASDNFMDYLRAFNYDYSCNPVLYKLEEKVVFWDNKYKKLFK